jgi:outer membrane protein assembly factor BamD (BamD/ComL family)
MIDSINRINFFVMKLKLFGILIFLFGICMSCDTNKETPLEKQISSLEDSLFKKNIEKPISKKDAAQIIQLYTSYAEQYPENPKAAEYLFKAADVSINVFRSRQTIKLFDQFLKKYPNNNKAPEALFLKAFTFENYLQEIDSAKNNYEKFLRKYPKHRYAKDAESSIKNLGTSAEELINSFE